MEIQTSSGWHILEVIKGRKKVPSVLYYIPNDPILSEKIAGFDLVNTLIWSNRGDYTVRGSHEWVWRSDKVPSFIVELIKDGWTPVIFSNYISKNLEELQERVQTMFKDITTEIFFFASLISDDYQKPNTGMWKLFRAIWEKISSKTLVPTENSFYIGDRSGDPSAEDPLFRKGGVEVSTEELKRLCLAVDAKLGDDSLFAARIGLNFVFPSELPSQDEPLFPPEGVQELIIMVGQQGSGKTTWAVYIAAGLGYSIMGSEELTGDTSDVDYYIVKDKTKRIKVIEQLLKEGKSVIVDATHPSIVSRQQIIGIGKRLRIPVRIFWVSQPGRVYNECRIKPVPEIALRTYTKQFEMPTSEEGAEVVRIV